MRVLTITGECHFAKSPDGLVHHSDELKAALHLIRAYIVQPDKEEDIDQCAVRACEVVGAVFEGIDLIGKQMLMDFQLCHPEIVGMRVTHNSAIMAAAEAVKERAAPSDEIFVQNAMDAILELKRQP